LPPGEYGNGTAWLAFAKYLLLSLFPTDIKP
jgi:hypothetical protein